MAVEKVNAVEADAAGWAVGVGPGMPGITRQATGRLGGLAAATRLRYAVSEIQEVRQTRRLPHQFCPGYIGGSVVFADRARQDRF